MKQPPAHIKRRRADYLARRSECEYHSALRLSGITPGWLSGVGWTPHDELAPTEVDHLFGRNGVEDDAEHASNYMAAHWIVHNWKTDHDRLGRILAIWWKHALRFDEPDGWEPERMSRVFGQDVLDWLENQSEQVPELFRGLIAEVIEGDQ